MHASVHHVVLLQAAAQARRSAFFRKSGLGSRAIPGTSGTVTTLAGVYLGLERYDRKRVDGLWLERADVDAGVLVDTWHFFHGPDGWDELEALPLARLAYVQFDDHPALESPDLREECLHRRVFPGEGLFEDLRLAFGPLVRRRGAVT